MATIAFIGLGVMGHPMAGHLARAGYDVSVWNRTSEKSGQWAEQYPGKACDSIADAVANAEAVLTGVGADEHLEEVSAAPDGIISYAPATATLVDHTTAAAGIAETLAQAARARGQGFIDAPVSGGQQGAENGQLTIMCGGSTDDFSKVKPVLECYARALNLIGPVGSGQKTKMVNQIAIAGLVQGLSEALHFAEQAELDVRKVVDVISKGT